MNVRQARHKTPPVSAGLVKEAAGLGLEILRLPGGLALLEPGLTAKKQQQFLAALSEQLAGQKDAARTGRTRHSSPESQNQLLDLLQHELERLQHTRLPCALLLLELAAAAAAGQIAARIKATLDHQDALAPYDPRTLALLLPGNGLGRARIRAARLQQELAEAAPGKKIADGATVVAIGLGIYHAHERLTPEAALERAVTELARARREGNGCLRHSDDRQEEQLCQVTDLERHQLFSIFQKEF